MLSPDANFEGELNPRGHVQTSVNKGHSHAFQFEVVEGLRGRQRGRRVARRYSRMGEGLWNQGIVIIIIHCRLLI